MDSSKVLIETMTNNRSLLYDIAWIIPPLGPHCYNFRMWMSRMRGKGISVLMSRIKSTISEKKAARVRNSKWSVIFDLKEKGEAKQVSNFIDFFLDAESGDLANGEVRFMIFFLMINAFLEKSNKRRSYS